MNSINHSIILFLIAIINTKELKQNNINSFLSYITIKINKTGVHSIFHPDGPVPDEVYINNIKQENINNKYNFNKTENIIKLIWNNKIQNCNKLFLYCNNITYINLTQFDFSLGITAFCMFYSCKSLTELIFPSSVIKITDAGAMFAECKSLTSLNNLNFEVSTVRDFGHTFRDCESLTSLDLSSFKITNAFASKMFGGCKNLEYLNLYQAEFKDEDDLSDFFSGTRNLVICTKSNRIKNIVKDYSNCIINYCESNWRQKQKRLNTENNQCVPDCSNINYKYDYLSKCYNICPIGTYNDNYICKDCHKDCLTCDKPADLNNTNCKSCLDKNKYLKFGNCVDDCINGFYTEENYLNNKICNCDLKKCLNCSKESFEKNLCISCNNNYYEKYDELNKYYPFIECYKSPEGYYLDNLDNKLFYKKCYESCKNVILMAMILNIIV